MRRGAFTLIEVMLVVALLGLLAGATAWSMARQVHQATRREVVEEIVAADRMARLAARRMGRSCVLRFDLDHATVRRVMTGDAGTAEAAGHTVALPAGVMLARVVTVQDQAPAHVVAQDSGVVEIAYSTQGRSAGYAFGVRGTASMNTDAHPHDANEAAADEWVAVAGLTGQVTNLQDETQADNLFAWVTAGRPDAD